MGEVRKLQKKLRQIENLEIKVSLTPEERVKVQTNNLCFCVDVSWPLTHCNVDSSHISLGCSRLQRWLCNVNDPYVWEGTG